MKYLIRSLAALFVLGAFGFVPAAAQDVGDTVSATGCLAQEDDDEMEFVLRGAEIGDMMVADIELVAGEGVSLDGHVGHTVEATGVVIDDEEADEAEDMEEEEEEEEEDDDELHLQVTELRHVAASCDGGAR